MKKTSDWEKAFKKNPHIVYRNIGREAILVPVGKRESELGCIYSLNEVAARVWELIDGQRCFKEISVAILEEFEIDEKTAARDIAGLIEGFKDLKLIE